jgi:hypothetical protein
VISTKLVNSITKEEIKVGQEVLDFRGEKCIVRGWYPKEPPSTGRVELYYPEFNIANAYYPSVIDAEIVDA